MILQEISSLKVDAIMRQGIRRYTDQVGVLWNSLADYYIRAANFPRAHDVYEEAVNTVVTVRDFSQVFDAYAEFMESMVTTCMEALEQASNDEQKTERKASSALHVLLVKLVESWRLKVGYGASGTLMNLKELK